MLAMWLSLGPIPKAGDSLVSGFGLYDVLYDYVPGFNGVRVPARYAMIAGLFLAVLAGVRRRRESYARRSAPRQSVLGVRLVALACDRRLILIEGAAIPMEINRTWGQNEATPPARVFIPYRRRRPRSTSASRRCRPASAITEFPFGDAAWEIRYVYYAAVALEADHQRLQRQLPARVQRARGAAEDVASDPEAAWQSLQRLRLDARRRASKRICQPRRR